MYTRTADRTESPVTKGRDTARWDDERAGEDIRPRPYVTTEDSGVYDGGDREVVRRRRGDWIAERGLVVMPVSIVPGLGELARGAQGYRSNRNS